MAASRPPNYRPSADVAFPSARFFLCSGLLALLVALAWLGGSSIGQSASAFEAGRSSPAQTEYPRAPGIEGIAHWVGSPPLSLSDLRGQVVLLDFWTYTCVNCIRTLPQLREWNDRYGDEGLVVLGIHTPEFEFEKSVDNVSQAAQSLGVAWPVAMDNDYVTWDNYENLFWPTKYLIDARGRIRYHRVGEGGYAVFEERIRELLTERNGQASGPAYAPDLEHNPDSAYQESPDREITRELYAGYERGDFEREYYGRGFVGQDEFYTMPGQQLLLESPKYKEPGFLYFQGPWINEEQYAAYAKSPANFEDHVSLVYSGRTVNAVLGPTHAGPIRVQALQDGSFLTEEEAGADVVLGEDGESFLLVDRPRMYQVVANPFYQQRKELQLRLGGEGLKVYAFTFGIYDQGP